MLDTKIFDTQEILQDRFDSIDTKTDFFKSATFLLLITTVLTIAISLQTMHLLQGPLPLFVLIPLSIIALSYFYSVRASILLLVSLFAIYGLSTVFALSQGLPLNQGLPTVSGSFLGLQTVVTLGSILLAMYSRVLKTSLRWQEKVKHFAETHDDLTALPNKESFIHKLDTIINDSSTKQERFALVLIDINALQKINQEYGYKAGNAALHIIANRLRQVAQEDDLIARIEDDCFALIVRDMAHNAQLKGYIERVIAMLNLPFKYGWTAINLETKVSSSFYPLDGKTAEELLSLNIKKLG